MVSEARVRVSLDTKRAKGDLRKLVQEGQRAGSRISGSVSGALRSGIQMAGLGAGVGAGVAAVRGAASSGAGDIASDLFGGWGRSFEHWAFGDNADQARANRVTREQMRGFAYQIGDGPMPQPVKNIFDQINKHELRRQQGISAIEREGDFRISLDKIISRLTDALTTAIMAGAKEISNSLKPFGGTR